MTAITKLENQFYGMLENPTVINPKLSQAIVSTDTVIKLTTPVQYPDTTIPALPFMGVIKNAITGYSETFYAPASALSADGKTITLTNINQRGINPSFDSTGAVDFASGSSTRRADHPQGSEVRLSIHPLFFKMMQKVLQGEISNNAHDFIVGDGTATNNTYSYSDAGGTKGLIRKNNATGKSQFSNDGTTWVNMDNAGIGVLAAGNAIDATALAAGTVQVKTTADTNVFVATSSGAADQNKAPICNASGKLADGFQNITAANNTTLTGGGSADSLHTHPVYLSSIFGGTSADGAFSQTSGTGSITTTVKNYSSFNISVGATVNCTQPQTLIKVSGNVTIAGTLASNATGGAGGSGDSGTGNNGTDGGIGSSASITASPAGKKGGANSTTAGAGGGGGGSGVTVGSVGSNGNGNTGGAGGGASASSGLTYIQAYGRNYIFVNCGGGGGGGGGGANSNNVGDGGGGGAGGGAIIIECGGALNFTGTISVAGANGSNGTTITAGGGGGGGGAGGQIVILYNTLTANTGTKTLTSGTGGAGGTGAGAGGAGGAGSSLIEAKI